MGSIIGLGLRLAGHRENRARAIALAAWAAITVLVLVLVTSLPAAIRRADEVREARAPVDNQGIQVDDVHDTVAFVERSTLWRGRQIRIVELDGSTSTTPVGVSELPQVGELVVSPALAARLRDPGSRSELSNRLSGTVVGEVAEAGLSGPEELLVYVGAPVGSLSDEPLAGTLYGWGIRPGAIRTETLPGSVSFLFATLLVIPVLGLFVSGLGYGSRRREATLRRLRSLGAAPSSSWVLVATEAVPSVVLGALVGAVLTPVAAGAIAGLFPPSVRPFSASLAAAGTGDWVRIGAAMVVMVAVGAYLVARNLRPSGQPRRSRFSRATRWVWPMVLGVSLVSAMALSGVDGLESPAILGIAVVVSTCAVMSLPALITATMRGARLLGDGLTADLSVSRLRFAGTATYRGAQGVVCALIVLALGIGVIRVLDAATTVGDVVWNPDQVRDDVAFVSADAEGAESIATGPEDGHFLRVIGATGDGFERRVLVARCGTGSALLPGSAGTDCPRVVVDPESTEADVSQTTVKAGPLTFTAPVEVSPIGAPSQFLGDSDGAVVFVDADTWSQLSSALPETIVRDLAIVVLDSDDPAAIEQIREQMWAHDGLAFSGGRTSLSAVVMKQDISLDGRYYNDIYGTITLIFSVILIGVFAITAFFGASADVGDGRDQVERLELLGAERRTQLRVVWLRSAIPLACAVGLGAVAGVVLGISYSRMSGYTDVLTGYIAGYPIVAAAVVVVVAAAVLVASVGLAIASTLSPQPLERLRDR